MAFPLFPRSLSRSFLMGVCGFCLLCLILHVLPGMRECGGSPFPWVVKMHHLAVYCCPCCYSLSLSLSRTFLIFLLPFFMFLSFFLLSWGLFVEDETQLGGGWGSTSAPNPNCRQASHRPRICLTLCARRCVLSWPELPRGFPWFACKLVDPAVPSCLHATFRA